jgi:transcription antitermination factor NusG
MLHTPQPGVTWRIGDTLPPAAIVRGPVGHDIPPTWFALEVPTQGERAAADWLEARGVEAWFPTETVTRKAPRTRRTVVYDRPIISRFVFCLFTGEPQWDVLFASRRVTGFIGAGGQPRPITEAEMARMAHVSGLIADAQRLAAEVRMIRPGDVVMIGDGAMKGWTVTVSAMEGAIARFVVPILGDHETEISVCRLTKTQGLA